MNYGWLYSCGRGSRGGPKAKRAGRGGPEVRGEHLAPFHDSWKKTLIGTRQKRVDRMKGEACSLIQISEMIAQRRRAESDSERAEGTERAIAIASRPNSRWTTTGIRQN